MFHASDQSPINTGGSRFARRQFLTWLTLTGTAIVVAACSSGGSTTGSNDSNSATAVARVSSGMNGLAAAGQAVDATTVKITAQNAFDPAKVTIPTGGSVVWVNAAAAPHSATFDPAKAASKSDVALPEGAQPFDSGLIQPGQSWTHRFTTAGTYQYVSAANEVPTMKGTVIVT